MGSDQGWLESDSEYSERTAREANERIVEDSTGSAPNQGWLESDQEYNERIANEANERTIEDTTGRAAKQGWVETDQEYSDRLAREANECTVESSTGSAPNQGVIESDTDYSARVRKEANEKIIEQETGSAPKQGWLESDHDYRSRISNEAREAIARRPSSAGKSDNPPVAQGAGGPAGSSGGSSGTSSIGAGVSGVAIIGIVLATCFACPWGVWQSASEAHKEAERKQAARKAMDDKAIKFLLSKGGSLPGMWLSPRDDQIAFGRCIIVNDKELVLMVQAEIWQLYTSVDGGDNWDLLVRFPLAFPNGSIDGWNWTVNKNTRLINVGVSRPKFGVGSVEASITSNDFG
jgi:hypothetical protein